MALALGLGFGLGLEDLAELAFALAFTDEDLAFGAFGSAFDSDLVFAFLEAGFFNGLSVSGRGSSDGESIQPSLYICSTKVSKGESSSADGAGSAPGGTNPGARGQKSPGSRPDAMSFYG